MNRLIKDLIPELFGDRKLTLQELWAFVKILRIARLRCRNNAALNNQLGAAFPHARFRQVQKQRPSRYNPAVMESYPGLEISIDGKTEAQGDEEI
jgi:hypothetical protein